jgi:hypothetical protein
MIRLSVGDLFIDELIEFAKRDDVCDVLIPSDIRAMASALKKLTEDVEHHKNCANWD